MIRYELKKDWMKKIQDGICPESIHPNTGRAVFVYCTTITSTNYTTKSGKYPKYSIEHGNFFPTQKDEISEGFFVIHKGFVDSFSDYGVEMFEDGFQAPQEVLAYAKNEVIELEKQVTECLVNNTFKTNDGVPKESVEIALAAWLNFSNKFEKAIAENKIVTFEMAIEMQSTLNN